MHMQRTASPHPEAGPRRAWCRTSAPRRLPVQHAPALTARGAAASAAQAHWPGWHLALPRRCRARAAHPEAGPATATTSTAEGSSSSSGSSSKGEQWASLRLLKRQLDVAVSEENYELAAALRDELKSQVTNLPAVQQYLLGQVSALQRSGASVQQRQQAIRAMIDAGDDVVVPDLATCLTDPELADLAYEGMWALFMRNPDPDINELMVRGVSLMHSPATRDVALAVFNDMVRRAPHFAEGYNKRATVLYTMKRFEESIEDCKKVLAMQPYHFGAASGMGLCYLMLSREQEAVEAFELALTIHPGMADISRVLKELRKRMTQPAGTADTQGQEGEDGQKDSDPR